MPQIMKDSKQELALENIRKNLEEIGKINAVIAAGDYSFKLTSSGGAKGKFDIASGQNERIVALLKERKKDLVRETKNTAKANRITFDSAEENAMSDAAFAPKKAAQAEPVEPEAESELDDENEEFDEAAWKAQD